MKPSFLITRPEHDIVVTYLAKWSKEVLTLAKNKNIKFSDFRGARANRKNIGEYLSKQNPELVVFNGHGNEKMISGHNDEPLILNKKNEKLLNSKIVYARACNAAKELGKNAVNKGCKTFIGYSGPFGFVRDINRETTPQKDKLAKPFKEVSNIIVTSLLKGGSAREAIKKSKDLTSKLIKEYSASDAEPAHKDIRFWLFWDKYFLRALGDQTAEFL